MAVFSTESASKRKYYSNIFQEPFYINMRKNFYPKFIKAPFVSKHKDKFLGWEKPDFFTTAERSAVVC